MLLLAKLNVAQSRSVIHVPEWRRSVEWLIPCLINRMNST